MSSRGPKTAISQREKENFSVELLLQPYVLRSSAFLSGGAEFYLFENVVVGFFFFLFFLFLILAYPQNMGRKAVCFK